MSAHFLSIPFTCSLAPPHPQCFRNVCVFMMYALQHHMCLPLPVCACVFKPCCLLEFLIVPISFVSFIRTTIFYSHSLFLRNALVLLCSHSHLRWRMLNVSLFLHLLISLLIHTYIYSFIHSFISVIFATNIISSSQYRANGVSISETN